MGERLKDLIKKNGIVLPVIPGNVLAMETTGLADQGIQYVFLAATGRGDGPGAGYSPVAQSEVENCVRECFRQFEQLAKHKPLKSILFPIFGAGTAKQDPEQVIVWLLPTVVEAMKVSPACQETHLLARVESHRTALRKVAEALALERVGGTGLP